LRLFDGCIAEHSFFIFGDPSLEQEVRPLDYPKSQRLAIGRLNSPERAACGPKRRAEVRDHQRVEHDFASLFAACQNVFCSDRQCRAKRPERGTPNEKPARDRLTDVLAHVQMSDSTAVPNLRFLD